MTTPLPDWATQPTPVAPPPSRPVAPPAPRPATTEQVRRHEPDGGRHASPNCACGENDAGDQYRDPICARLDADPPEPPAPTPPQPAPDGTGPILGRALRESGTGTLWREAPDAGRDGEWWYAGGYGHAQRPEVEESAAERGNGPVREVLLVDPAAARALALGARQTPDQRESGDLATPVGESSSTPDPRREADGAG
jgi:hypothetical protein